jgi:hypothetical protein
MGHRTAFLHWCQAENVSTILGSGDAYDGKEVRMRADWYDGYREPKWFEVHEEAFFLRKLIRRLGNTWHPLNPFVTETKTPGLTHSRDKWRVLISKVSKQSSYYFTDDQKNQSGRLLVSAATHSVTHSGIMINEVHVGAKSHGIGVGVTVSGQAGKIDVSHNVRATQDPRVVVDVLTPNGDGPTSLTRHVQRLLLERLHPDSDYTGDYLKVPAELATAALIEAADGYLTPGQDWSPSIPGDDIELVIDEYRPGEIRVSIPDWLLNTTSRTAYALRVTDVENHDNFVISDIVMVDTDGDSVRIRS